MKKDHTWLEPWVPYLKNSKLLELGCGEGLDTRYLADHVESIVACDQNPRSGSAVSVMKVDHGDRLPFRDQEFDAVLASLCLHYFEMSLTKTIVNDISRVLTPGGLLLCRLNSTNDANYGATGYPEVEPGLHNVDGQLKRFFTESDVHKLFAEKWQIKELKERIIDRYEKDKVVWEFMAVKL